MFGTLLVANRGEIAARIIRSARNMGIRTIGVASDADRFTAPMRMADEVVRLGPGSAAETYLNVDGIVAACRKTGAEAVHPGYGFLSENVAFARRLAAEGIVFVGPTPENIEAFGLKHTARAIAERCGVPLLPGSGLLASAEAAIEAAETIGYPVMLKSTAGGGGIGMQLCRNEDELRASFAGVGRLASGNFGDARLFLERAVVRARHVEVQIFGDGKGGIVTLGERDCSLQRRNQKVVEETPAPNLSDATRRHLRDAALALGHEVAYASAGTVEFVYDADREEPYFLEVNTRLQVEHPVTEAIFGVDLVAWMIRQAAGEFELPPQAALVPRGHAIEARIYAEDPARDFRPSTGTITDLAFADCVRVDSWIETGTEVSALYDPMLAKLIVHGGDREDALERFEAALRATSISGIQTNLPYLREVARTPEFLAGDAVTSTLKGLDFHPRDVEVLAPGAQSSLQDWPGRLGYWDVGVPPSGPMDSRSHRLVNDIVGNAPSVAVLECTLTGPSLRFRTATTIALGGARMRATLDGAEVPYWRAVAVKPGQILALGAISGPGMRTYLAVRGGFDAPLHLGARATFALGGFGGHATGVLKAGDTLHLADDVVGDIKDTTPRSLPDLTHEWELDVHYGPHGAPDFFTENDIKELFASSYEVHFNSARTGVRLIGPTPEWARRDGGEAGLHPSNIHDNAYAIGSIDFTGDMPIILGPDGPSLGGFVCPAVVTKESLWKIGQLKPGDKVRFRQVKDSKPILARQERDPEVVYRRAGDDYLLVEYGAMALDLALRLRVHLLMNAVRGARLNGIIDLTPGIRSLQIHYDSAVLSTARLVDMLTVLERDLPSAETVTVPSRIVHLPLSWNDPQAQLAMRKYQELVRHNAPWCPSNIEFIRRINGLGSEEDVKRIVFDASYLVLGLGDVYLGAPVATPLDPRHRLVTTKYNPARTWTPENAVGIGGAYLCIYGMEGPGGYQLFGRTIQMWNRWRTTKEFERPYLLRFFDQVRFYPVSGAELTEAREAFPHGAYPLRIEETELSLAAHRRFLAAHAPEITRFKTHQADAFEAERRRWVEEGLDSFVADDGALTMETADAVPDGANAVHAPVGGSVWKIEAAPGDAMQAGQPLVIIESMKMEITIAAPMAGILRELRCAVGRQVQPGQIVAVLEAT